ncbi:lysoplasmalogenase family protein [Roseobacter sp. HKCCA0434]|uniref:lysoplasmalogenase family protein n=1 Tax=Roseobacter sp. HKCCA0434 TaxID=3079297 RepID=UPI002905AB02|nr:lysoplasmalogenase family protein [Roseobacter sp. HKCCA0434]
MIVETALIVASVGAALAYLVHFRLQPPTRARIAVKTVAAAALALAALIGGAGVTLIVFFALAAIADGLLAREDAAGFLGGLGVAVGSLLFLCLLLAQAWTGMEAPVAATLGLIGVWVGFFMLIWSSIMQYRPAVLVFAVAMMAATFLALGTETYGQLAVAGVLLYVLAQLVHALELFVLEDRPFERALTGPVIWSCYYASLILIFAAFRW